MDKNQNLSKKDLTFLFNPLNDTIEEFDTKTKNEIVEKVTLEDDEFDLSFTPINKGLGFHNEDEKIVPKKTIGTRPRATSKSYIPKQRSQEEILTEMSTKAAMPSKSLPKSINTKRSMPSESGAKGLSAFYKSEVNLKRDTETRNIISNRINKLEVEQASIVKRTFAYSFDLMAILFSEVLVFTLFALLSGIQFNVLVGLLTPIELIQFGSVLFGLFYVTYFSVLETSKTLGQTIVGLKLYSTDELTIRKITIRSCASLLSLLFVGIPFLFNFPSLATDTKLIED